MSTPYPSQNLATDLPKYIVGHWGHLFESDKDERMTRFVIDAQSHKVLRADIQASRAIGDSYREAELAELESLQQSLTSANPEVFATPEDFGLEWTEDLPNWVTCGFRTGDVLFYRQDPGAYGAIVVKAVDLKVHGDSANREMVLPFAADDLYTASEMGKELENLIFSYHDALFRDVKIKNRIAALVSAIKPQR